MAKAVHVIGNGDCSQFYTKEPRKGLKLACNVPPFEITDMYATCIVDYKMMNVIDAGQANPPGEWICGIRPKHYCETHPQFHMRIATRIKEFYLEKPKYAKNYTDFNCGHFAAYYALNKLKCERLHLWGFDSIFDFNLRSYTDVVINSDRGNMNNNRLSTNWRPIWQHMFKEFKDVEFVLHHKHDAIKIPIGDNVRIVVEKK